jgi:cyclic beta-1,2-glucan synthetase
MTAMFHGLFRPGLSVSPWNADSIIREELFSVERLEQHAASLALAQQVSSKALAQRSLNARLNDNEKVLLAAYRAIAHSAGEGHAITPAAEWLIDNYHLVEAQMRQIQDNLPPRFYRQLPKLAAGPLAGYPRVFGMAWAYVAHSDSRFEPETLQRFIHAYQKVQPLTIGELWAMAITLSIVLVENMRRAAQRVVTGHIARQQADVIADQLLGVNGRSADPEALRHLHAAATDSAVFMVQLIKRLRDQDPRVTPALEWLEARLIQQGTSSDAIVRDEHQRQGAANVTVRNIITSMRLISDVNWADCFEQVSLVDATLRRSGNFAGMDFATRNLYRSAIEQLARHSAHSELEIAHRVIAATDAGADASGRERDPGYFLLAHGRRAFERAINYRAPWRSWLGRLNATLGPAGYACTVVLMGTALLTLVLWLQHARGASPGWLIALGLLGIIPALDVAVALVNRAVMRCVGATLLPALELREGVPASLRTMVVMPTLLTTAAAIEEQIERLEVHYLASAQGEVHFALLSDWTDADTEHVADDLDLLHIATEGIARLNRRHEAMTAGARFYLLHRRRTWSEGQQQWLGWERKRGKLHELNRLLRGATDTSFMIDDQARKSLPDAVRYVITLDADTRLPRETVRRLIGKLAHPLNQPRFDVETGLIVDGYAVLQPRVTPSLPIGKEGSLFQRVFSSMTGIDAYDSVVSDVYQDLFGAGSYAGKGIYDLDAFEQVLADRVPEDSLLSHDLFEGTFARSGLVSDVEVVEEYPSRYDVAAARTHRWARGDWQLLPWIFGRGDAAHRRNDGLPLLARWKMLDNLRRTLSAPLSVLALLCGWLLPLHLAWIWTSSVLLTIALPALLPVLALIVPTRRGVGLRSHLRALSNDLGMALLQILFVVTFLAHHAWLMIDAIARTLFRLWFTRRNLLEWVTAAQAQLSVRLDVLAIHRRMCASGMIALLAIVLLHWTGSHTWPVATPFILLWLAAPLAARQASLSPRIAGRVPVSTTDAGALRLVARRTWRYFERFVTASEHGLPPDNFQEDPQPVLAHRTSPTNIGLYLLCVISARDFGWAGITDLVERLEATLSTLQKLPRHRGHFYNWYGTRDLRALEPRYVSSVDSGNLAAHLIAVANACHEWQDQLTETIIATGYNIAGISDALRFSRISMEQLPKIQHAQIMLRHQLRGALDSLEQALLTLSQQRIDSTGLLTQYLSDLVQEALTLTDSARALAGEEIVESGNDNINKHSTEYDELLFWTEAVQQSIASWHRDVTQSDFGRKALRSRLLSIENTTRHMAMAMEFGFLLDPARKLLSIGYAAAEGALDSNCYDLLASEARLASFFAIAKNDVPTRHWFRLGRAVTAIGHGAALISWSGSMFEYLMPSLVMRAPMGSLLEQTSRLIVRRQIAYGVARGVPWGASESAYAARDLEFTYQYSNFGVPGLGLKRGLSENLVIAPYATGLAAMVDPHSAMRNFAALSSLGALGRYGFYEALDFTRSRLPEGERVAIVRAYMAHHQGMTIVAIANVLFDGRMRARFHAETSVQATELLLQERTPRDVSIAHPRAEEVATAARFSETNAQNLRRLHLPNEAVPQTHLLSNGRYAVMLTSAGSGYTRWHDLQLTRWREDVTCDDAGSYVFLRDVIAGTVWSAGYQPSGLLPDSYDVVFSEDRAEFTRTDGVLTTTMQVVVSPEDDAEVRRISISNAGMDSRDIDVTSYSELVLASAAADSAHPAFSKLFVQTEYVARLGALLATRRRRDPNEAEIWAAHHATIEGEVLGIAEYETDRARFLGRGREVHEPIAVLDGRPLSNTVGTVLDPVFALRYRVRIAAGATVHLSFWTSVADSRTGVLDLLDKQNDSSSFVRATTLAWTQAQVQLRHLGINAEEASLFQRLAAHVLYANASMRPASDAIQRGAGTASALWSQGISGDLPIVLLRIDHIEDIDSVRQLLRAHEYWRMKQLKVDIVILNEHASSYVQDLQAALDTLVRMSQPDLHVGSTGSVQRMTGSVYVLRTDLISAETRGVLSAVARMVFVGQRGSLLEQLERRLDEVAGVTPSVRHRQLKPVAVSQASVAAPAAREFFNGMGGFADRGREYVTTLQAGQTTPAPWINVIANPQFGFQVAVEGSGFTWSINSRENQLTAWRNDPVTDRPGEALYVRDDETGDLWGPTVTPVKDAAAPYVASHGQGYSRFMHAAHDIELELLMYVPLDHAIKISRLKIRNTSSRRRHLSVTAYVEWVLGSVRASSAPSIFTEMDADTGAMLARNPWSLMFGSRVAFADMAGQQTQWTGDRREFLGRHGRLEQPAALLSRKPLARSTGAGLDPCCVMQAPVQLDPGESTELVFFLGSASNASEAQTLIRRYRTANLDRVLQSVTDHWNEVLGTMQVKTPDRAMDIMLNRWLLYQTLACRLWARSAFYQASGAYGFRDQLQDGMALAMTRPALTREHLLRAAGRQFREGDVQHWWLPPTGQGVRTHISDDRIWLAYAAAHYVTTTGDVSVLDESIGFLEGGRLALTDHDAYFLPGTSDDRASMFEHCARGLDTSLVVGVHGLPLMGMGDWNDGMNRVGEQGRGESVWLGWFLHTTLVQFATVADARGETARALLWRAHAAALLECLEKEAWDGGWYRRGFFDDGAPLGSQDNDECRIDSIAQSWSVICGAADPARTAQAMAAVESQLIREEEGLALLFAPPFDRTPLEPGYIKGYPPGLRENGGQYTHAATWSVIAFAKLGQADQAMKLWSMLNPVNKTSTRTGLRRYKVEPYVLAADVYSVAPHVGRGGWTWYTGAAGWLYRAGIESILGLRQQGNRLLVAPCIPAHWPGFEVTFKYKTSRYQITVENPQSVNSGVIAIAVDDLGLIVPLEGITLLDDGAVHQVHIVLG